MVSSPSDDAVAANGDDPVLRYVRLNSDSDNEHKSRLQCENFKIMKTLLISRLQAGSRVSKWPSITRLTDRRRNHRS
jgi:hypothetical protein